MLCSEWVPSEWVQTADKNSFLTLNHCFRLKPESIITLPPVKKSISWCLSHLTAPIHCRGCIKLVMEWHISPNLMNTQTLGWPEGEHIFRWTIPLSRSIKFCYRDRITQWLVIFQIHMVSVQQWCCGGFKHCTCQGESSSSWTGPSALNPLLLAEIHPQLSLFLSRSGHSYSADIFGSVWAVHHLGSRGSVWVQLSSEPWRFQKNLDETTLWVMQKGSWFMHLKKVLWKNRRVCVGWVLVRYLRMLGTPQIASRMNFRILKQHPQPIRPKWGNYIKCNQ